MLRTHCCRHKCFLVCPRPQHLLRTQILCPGHKKCFWFWSETFCVRNKCFPVCAAQETSWATMCPQQCVLVYQGLNDVKCKIDFKVKNDHRSKFSNLSNWKEEAWKNQGFNGIRTRDLRDTGAMLYQLGYEATNWERGQFIEFESRWSPDFFRLLLSNCLNWKIYCDDHSSLWSTTAVQIYDLFHIYLTSK